MYREVIPAYVKDSEVWTATDRFRVVPETAGLNEPNSVASDGSGGCFLGKWSGGARHSWMPTKSQYSH